MRLFRLLTLLGVMVWWAGCGLPDSFYLVPPSVGLQSASQTAAEFDITGTSRDSDTGATFQGYELYYKFYGSTTDTTFNHDFTSFGTGSTYTDLVQAGFHRLCLGTTLFGLTADTTYGSASAPLVNISVLDPANTGQSYLVRIRFNDSTPVPPAFLPTPQYSGASLSYYLYAPPGLSPSRWEEVRRYANIPGTTGCKLFASNILTSAIFPSDTANYDPINANNDPDLTGSGAAAYMAASAGSGYIIVMIYALSYGKSIVDGTPIYSSPVLLGYSGVQISP
jgi:hypothetical protein